MATVYYRQSLTGGGTNALDNTDGNTLADGDAALVLDGTSLYVYQLDASSGASEDSPNVITPDTNPGNKRWILQTVQAMSGVLRGVKDISGTTHTITDDDVGYLLSCSNASGCAITTPASASPLSSNMAVIHVVQAAAGQVTFTAGSGATLKYGATFTAATQEQESIVSLIIQSSTIHRLAGQLEV